MQKNNESAKINKFAPLVFVLHCMTGILICLAISLVFSLLISREKISPSSVSLLSCISVIIGAGVASVLSAKKFGKVLIISLAQGLVCFVVLYILGTIVFSRFVPHDISPSVPLSCFAGALSGAIITALFKKRRRH